MNAIAEVYHEKAASCFHGFCTTYTTAILCMLYHERSALDFLKNVVTMLRRYGQVKKEIHRMIEYCRTIYDNDTLITIKNYVMNAKPSKIRNNNEL